MDINHLTDRIPFRVLYLIAACITVFDLAFTYVFLSDNTGANEGNPVHAFFVGVFGLEYFLFLIPVALVGFFAAAKFGGWLIQYLDKRTQINGKNYVLVIIILFTLPNVLFNELFLALFGTQLAVSGFNLAFVIALVLVLGYILLAEAADRKAKKNAPKASSV
jgi:hypothetical protein